MKRWLGSLAAGAMLLIFCMTSRSAVADEGWHAGVDMLFLSPKISDQGVARIFYYGDTPTTDGEGGSMGSPLDFAQRVSVGYEGDLGGGMQVRWFTFDNDVDYVGEATNGGLITLAGTTNLNVDAVDIELTQRGDFAAWDWLATGGVRYASAELRENAINFEDLPDFVWAGSTGFRFEGAGPTVSVRGTRPILCDGFSLFGGARTALLFGDLDLWSAFSGNGVYRIGNEFVQVWEIQFGAELERQFDAFDLVTRIFWEAQRWDSDSDYLGDLGLHGFGVGFGVEY